MSRARSAAWSAAGLELEPRERPVAAHRPPIAAPPVPEPPPVADAPPAVTRGEHAGELSGLRLLLDQLDALLRDPTLTRALRAFSGRLGAGVRELAAAIAAAGRRLARSIPRLRLRFPRRLLLGLLAAALPLALLALLTSSHDRHTSSAADRQAATARPAAGGAALGGVAMPALRAAPDHPPPVNVALVVDGSYDPAALRRELRALGSWLAVNHAPGTRVSVIDGVSARESPPLRAADLAGAHATRQRASTAAAVRSAFAASRGRRLLVTIGSTAPASRRTSALSVATRRGASASPTVALRRGGRATVTIDARRSDALAASVARAIAAISGEHERR
ncbi:MAG TPA: hypothetical protein VHZ31_02955 [Solirubrobacteraceae bacterium]|nr:hypothetical protein [Solirubrobacteraceae bacterium]